MPNFHEMPERLLRENMNSKPLQSFQISRSAQLLKNENQHFESVTEPKKADRNAI